ncbi:asparaginase [Terasakiella sp. A23]|uniref:asparaginase n=1 Tax=Terasakiella sp. FCG-A23 TaxID=3080561 RepID=UPI0029540D7B|nr:asparaginase [Terasakiella sp. A23]MDV7341303.1 asparaginase [Terasakiella sp. A23]
MSNPVLVEVTRGGIVESRHRGAFCVIDPNGDVVLNKGDIDQDVFGRSSIKAIQALAFVESGAADAFGFSDEELALACSSHGGEVQHVGAVTSMLNKMGLSKELLKCGSHWPMNEAAGRSLAMEGETPSVLHNNCSGKHAGFLAYLKHNKVSPVGYTEPDHPLQVLIRETLEDLCEVDLSDAPVGIDGCAIPTWAFPLKNLALGFSKFANPAGRVSADREAAMKKLTKAIFAAPFMVAGTDRYCTRMMTAFPEKVFIKLGAEGVFTAFVPEKGYGFAVKCDDGTYRGAEMIVSAILVELGVFSKEDFDRAGVADLYEKPLLNRNGTEVGVVRRAF